jgi:hypothetical protein
VERNPTLSRNSTYRPFRSLQRLRGIAKRPEGRSGALIDALEADALLLREENARLRVKLESSPDVGHVIERLRALTTPRSSDAEHGDEAWRLFTEAIVLRNALIEVCKEIGEAMASLEARLESLTAPSELSENGSLENGHRNGHRGNQHLEEARPQ